MRTKWMVAGLFVMGVLAAVGAAMLVAGLRADQRRQREGQSSQQIEVVVASRPLAAMTVIDGSCVAVRKMPRSAAPQKAVISPDGAIGRVLASPLARNAVLSEASFVTEGAGRQLAAALTSGMRAVAITLTDYGGLEGLLYPGCNVDVMAVIKVPARDGTRSHEVSVPLLQQVQVLAVGDQTVFSEAEPANDRKLLKGHSRQRVVTLKVTPEQARSLQLAMEMGTLSLALRNPFDEGPVNLEPMLVNDILLRRDARLASFDASETVKDTPLAAPRATSSTGRPEPVQVAMPPPDPITRRWEVMVIRGDAVKTESLEWGQ